METPSFGRELRRLRRSVDLTLIDLADPTGLSIAYVSQIERGDRSPPAQVVIKQWADILGCPDRLPELLKLAAISQNSITIKLKDRRPDELEFLVTLARKTEGESLTPDQIRAIMGIFGNTKE